MVKNNNYHTELVFQCASTHTIAQELWKDGLKHKHMQHIRNCTCDYARLSGMCCRRFHKRIGISIYDLQSFSSVNGICWVQLRKNIGGSNLLFTSYFRTELHKNGFTNVDVMEWSVLNRLRLLEIDNYMEVFV